MPRRPRRRFARRRFRRSSAKTDGDWITLQWAESTITVDSASMAAGQTFLLLGASDIAEHDEDVTIQRMVGRFIVSPEYITGAPSTGDVRNVSFHERITLRSQSLESLNVASITDIRRFNQANESFLWHRVRPMWELPVMTGSGMWADTKYRAGISDLFDVRVKRKLLPGTALALILQTSTTSDADQWNIRLFMRAWVKF